MAKTITIPDCGRNPLFIKLNNYEYTFYVGQQYTVDDEVAALIEDIYNKFPTGSKEPGGYFGDSENISYNGKISNHRNNSVAEKIASMDAVSTRSYNTVAEMQAATDLVEGLVCHTNGYYSSGDGGAAFYKITSSGTVDGISILQCSNNLIANLIDEGGPIIVEKYGISKRNTASVNSAILSSILSSNKTFVFSNGSYRFNSIEFDSTMTNIRFVGTRYPILCYEGSDYFINFNKSSYIYFEGIIFNGVYGSWKNGCISVANDNSFDFFFKDCVFSYFTNVIYLNKTCWNGQFINCIFRNNGTPLYINANSTYLNFIGCTIENYTAQAVYISSTGKADNLNFDNCLIEASNTLISGDAIIYDASGSSNIKLANCYLEQGGGSAWANKRGIIAASNTNLAIKGTTRTRHCEIEAANFYIQNDSYLPYICENLYGFEGFNLGISQLKQQTMEKTYKRTCMICKNLFAKKIAYLEVTDTLPEISSGKYGTDGKIYGTYADMTTYGTLPFSFSDELKNEYLYGRKIVVEYDIVDSSTFLSSNPTFGILPYNGNTLLDNVTWWMQIQDYYPVGTSIPSGYKLMSVLQIQYHNCDNIRIQGLRNNSYYKASAIYII